MRLSETVVHADGTSHVLVTTVERHPTAVRCPCTYSCGAMVRVGQYARYAKAGTPVCPHCRASVGSEHGFSSYAQLAAHVNTKSCQAVQANELKKSPKSRFGKKQLVRINGKASRITKNGVVCFRCFRCLAELRYESRFMHCLVCLAQ
ncbi:unnamed protein product [Agarophyton chilense]